MLTFQCQFLLLSSQWNNTAVYINVHDHLYYSQQSVFVYCHLVVHCEINMASCCNLLLVSDYDHLWLKTSSDELYTLYSGNIIHRFHIHHQTYTHVHTELVLTTAQLDSNRQPSGLSSDQWRGGWRISETRSSLHHSPRGLHRIIITLKSQLSKSHFAVGLSIRQRQSSWQGSARCYLVALTSLHLEVEVWPVNIAFLY